MKRTIEILLRLFAPPVRLAVAALAALAAGGAGAATYMMSNANGSAMQWDGGYNWNSGAISFNSICRIRLALRRPATFQPLARWP